MTINFIVEIMTAYFQKCGSIEGFTSIVDKHNFQRKTIQIIDWLLGYFILFFFRLV